MTTEKLRISFAISLLIVGAICALLLDRSEYAQWGMMIGFAMGGTLLLPPRKSR